MGDVILLGPQRLRPTVGPVLESLGLDGRICVISAGWQEREGELDELSGHLHRPVDDLALYRRCEEVFAQDAELFAAVRTRQDRLKDAQRLYRIRLRASLQAVRRLADATAEAELLSQEKRAALRSLQALDRHHLQTIHGIHADFEERWQPARRPAVLRIQHELAERLETAAALLIAGGHVQVLLNRIRLVGLAGLLPQIPLIAWSAGAMVLAQRIVLFHDTPPHGAGKAEVLDVGLGAFEGIVPLPHARRRLDLGDAARVALFARRFSPSVCVTMDEGAYLAWRNGSWTDSKDCRQLTRSGAMADVAV